jgi:hypothetical protein
VLRFPLFDRQNSAAKTRELGEFLLNRLQAFLPFTVSHLGLRVIAACTSILFVQRLNLSDLGADVLDLFAKHCKVIHTLKNNAFDRLSAGRADFAPFVSPSNDGLAPRYEPKATKVT